MQKLALSPFRGELGVIYDAAFLYLTVRGAVAERWGHTPGFGRHAIAVDGLRLTNASTSRIAEVNLKNSRFVMSGPDLNWSDFVTSAHDFLGDCLKMLQPAAVSSIYCDLKLCSDAQSFDAERDAIASELLVGRYREPPTSLAVFEDLSVGLVFRQNQTHIHTMLGPMKRHELSPLLDNEPDLDAYPKTLLFVHRRFEVRPGANPGDRLDLDQATKDLESLVSTHLTNAPRDVSAYISTLLQRQEA